MTIHGIAVLIVNFAIIGLLPVIFFKRDGKFNVMWWLTGAPFFISIASVLASFFGFLPALQLPPFISVVAVLLSLCSIALIAFTLGSHRIPIALWHQNNDAPVHIVTWGAYERIRHPFYASFLLAFLANLLYCPQVISAVCFVYGCVVLNVTAAREERRLASSQFGPEYQEYMRRTGRFIPRLI